MATPTVDADSHIEEVEEIWDHLEPEFQSRRPFPITLSRPIEYSNLNALWYIEGNVYPKVIGPGSMVFATPLTSDYARAKPFSVGSQGLTDVEARLRDMDRAGVDVQVIFPTLFLATLTDDLRYEAALIRAYNTYLAAACAQRPERLKWAALAPFRDPTAAVAEIRRAKELGCSAVVTLGTAGDLPLQEPRLDPIYAEMERLDLPLCVHVGWSNPGLNRLGDNIFTSRIGFTLPVLAGFWGLVGGGVLDRFTSLRVSFLEAGSEWLPYWVGRMDHYYHSDSDNQRGGYMPRKRPSEYLKEGRIYFTCEAEEAGLPEAIALLGEDQMMVSADMPHGEARERAFDEVRERTDISERVKEKMMGENAARFYKL